MTWHFVQQRSEEWFRLRLGKVTSTRLSVIAHGTLAAQTKLLDQMQEEIEDPDECLLRAMDQWAGGEPAAVRLGKEREDWLRARYEIMLQKEHGKAPEIETPGLIDHPHVPRFASSPDWVLRKPFERVGEGKVRTDPTKHAFAIKHGLLPEDKCQVHAHMMCAGIEKCDYVSYCPFWDDDLTNVHIVTVNYDREFGDYLYAELRRFLTHLEKGTRPTMDAGLSGIPSFFDED